MELDHLPIYRAIFETDFSDQVDVEGKMSDFSFLFLLLVYCFAHSGSGDPQIFKRRNKLLLSPDEWSGADNVESMGIYVMGLMWK